ncbi:MAG: hypothetical protein ICV65_13330, partial [Flavisolibacter sp.]|nr:hypothetical protein [Flavisolibacter sp.]
THKGKYFTPDISQSGKSLIAVSIDDSLQTELHVLNRADGKLIRKIKAKSDAYFLHPKFISEQTIVLAIRTMDGRMSLNTMDLETEKTGELIAPSVNTLGNPFVSDGKVYFTASYAGNDDVYVFDLTEKKLYQLTSGQTGNYYAAAYRDSLTWSQFTARGLQIKSASLKSLDKGAFATTGLKQVVPYPVAGSEPNLLATPNKRFSVKRYNQTYRFINFHSWNPDYTDPEFSITVSSNNILNTFANELSYIYNRAEQSHTVGFNALYGGFFPVLSAGIDYTFNRHINRGNIEYLFHQRELRLGYSIPLNFSQGKTYKLLNLGSNFVFNQLQPTGAFKDSMREQHSTYLHHFILFRQQLPRALQHIYPRWGYAISLQHRHRLDKSGYQALGAAEIYLPSFRNQSIVFGGSFQQTDTSNVLFTNRFSNARGYKEYYFPRMWKVTGNYHFPIFYPDWGAANIVYFLRMRANLFFDYSRVYSRNKSQTRDLRSTGAELFFDTRWWNQLPVTFGVRYSYLLDKEITGRTNHHQFELVLPLNLIPD